MTVKCRKYFLAKWNSDLVQWWQGLARRRSPHAEVLHTFRCRGERPEILEGPRRRPRRPQLVKNALNAPHLSVISDARGEGGSSCQLGLNFGSLLFLGFTHSARTLWLGVNGRSVLDTTACVVTVAPLWKSRLCRAHNKCVAGAGIHFRIPL